VYFCFSCSVVQRERVNGLLSANRPECCARPYFKLGQRFLPRFVGLCLPLATSLGIVIVALLLVRRALKWRYPI
jgi:hypothetical protein